ncbi:uncharacterized protein LOC119729174 [Patiria miniata]|uniref:Uncharacterized protein n=1 Tax=Patiria miniata TaxID=46514 RepID=A0A914A1X5_PATMI|nr:uncharacterized protein LOC119729174 [Patiria miniata]
MVGVGAVLLLVGVVLFVLGVVPGSMAGDVVKWPGAVCGVLGIVLLVASVAVYISASRTKDTENYSVTNEESTVSKNCRSDRPRSIIREPSLKPRGGCVKATPGGYTSFLYSPNYKGEEPTGD